ncbi:hypothetical protein HY968_02630 [Candidatus Kaiserbacteria bacterium]|nr:hypothetical protein [Candidatus Kaiserbacteria bacterium]
MTGERPTGWGKKLVEKAGKLMDRAHEALVKNDPHIRDPHIDIEHNSVRVFFPRTGLKVDFRLVADPILTPDKARVAMDNFLTERDRTPASMRKHKIYLVSKSPKEENKFDETGDDFDPENDVVGKRKLTARIIREEYGVTYDEYADAWYLARNTLLRRKG